MLRGLVKSEKIQKSDKNSDWPDPTYPPPYKKKLETCTTTKKQHKKKQIKKTFPRKKKNPSWGFTHPPTSEFFSDFRNFFNLTKPLTAV